MLGAPLSLFLHLCKDSTFIYPPTHQRSWKVRASVSTRKRCGNNEELCEKDFSVRVACFCLSSLLSDFSPVLLIFLSSSSSISLFLLNQSKCYSARVSRKGWGGTGAGAIGTDKAPWRMWRGWAWWRGGCSWQREEPERRPAGLGDEGLSGTVSDSWCEAGLPGWVSALLLHGDWTPAQGNSRPERGLVTS